MQAVGSSVFILCLTIQAYGYGAVIMANDIIGVQAIPQYIRDDDAGDTKCWTIRQPSPDLLVNNSPRISVKRMTTSPWLTA